MSIAIRGIPVGVRWLVIVLVACSAPAVTRPQPVPGLRLPDDVTPLGYDLRLAIDPAQEAFHGDVAIRVRLARPARQIWLAAVDLDVATATLDGARLAIAAHTDQMIALAGTFAAGEHTVALAYTGHTAHDQEGLFRQQAKGRWYAFSQGESLLMRRIVPCLDEPRWKTPWRVTLVVPADQVALGNMPTLRETVHGATREVVLAETPPMPSYLVAVAVGPFELVDAGTAGAKRIPVRIAALAGQKDRVGVGKLTAKVLDAVEAYVGSPLAWPKLDLVVVPHLFGAMENPGLITFDADMLVGDPKALAPEFVRTEAHELVHQWFGNSVTPAWWDDLWLSEAFASWLGDKVSAQLGMLDDAALALALDREHALEADAATDARPLHHVLDRADDADDAFDAISYEKGRAVLATFEAFVGEAKLRDALRGYLAAHANATATTKDLIAALPDASSALAGYLDHAGVPVVDVTASCDKLVLHARDHLSVPVCVRTDKLPRTCVLAGEHTEVPLAACPAWVWPNDGAGYYQIAWQGAHAPVPMTKLAPNERIALGDDEAAAFVRGDISATAALAELDRLAAGKDAYAQLGALAIARVIDPLVAPAQRAAWASWLATHFAERLSAPALLGANTPADRELRDVLLLLIPADHLPRATTIGASRLLERTGPTPGLVAMANLDHAAITTMAEQAERDLAKRDDLLEALAMGPAIGAPDIADLVAVRNLPALPAIEGYLERGATRGAMWDELRPRLATILARLPADERAELIDATAALCDDAAGVEAAFAPHLRDIPAGRRHLDHAVARIKRCTALRTRTGNLPL